MSIVEEIRSRMARYPHAQLKHDATSITCFPSMQDGFIVQLIVQKQAQLERYFVFYAGSCQEEEGRSGSVINFGFGLSTGCRLREFSHRGRPYRWITDIQGWKGWKPYWETFRFGAPFWQFWLPPKVGCLQNRLIDLDAPASGAACPAAHS